MYVLSFILVTCILLEFPEKHQYEYLYSPKALRNNVKDA